jgi:hypothetical protein
MRPQIRGTLIKTLADREGMVCQSCGKQIKVGEEVEILRETGQLSSCSVSHAGECMDKFLQYRNALGECEEEMPRADGDSQEQCALRKIELETHDLVPRASAAGTEATKGGGE